MPKHEGLCGAPRASDLASGALVAMHFAKLGLLVLLATADAAPPRPALRPSQRPAPSPTQIVALSRVPASPPSSPLALFWSKHGTLVATLVGSLVVLAPSLRKLPRQAALTATVLVVALVQMAFDKPPDMVLLEAVIALVGLNVLSMKEALDGFRAEGVVTVGVMCAVAKSVQTTGGVNLMGKYLLGSPKVYEMALLRMTVAVMAISAFMNNTPVCAMMIPILNEWAATVGVTPGSLLMPLSFATMLGGTLTMIGSSTNLVAANVAATHDPSFAMNVFDISAIGAINALAGTAYMVLGSRYLLPKPIMAPTKSAAADAAPSKLQPPPRGPVRLWLTLGLIGTLMTMAARQPKVLLPMAFACLCILVRAGCLTIKEAWSAVNGPVLLSIALSFALGEAIRKSEVRTCCRVSTFLVACGATTPPQPCRRMS